LLKKKGISYGGRVEGWGIKREVQNVLWKKFMDGEGNWLSKGNV